MLALQQIALVLLFLASSKLCGANDHVRAPANNAVTSNAIIWKCNVPDSDVLHELLSNGHQLSLEIISTHAHSVHVFSSTHNLTSLEAVGLHECTQLARAEDLFRKELSQNSHKLGRYTGEWSLGDTLEEQPLHITKRSEEKDRECVLSGKCTGQDDQWFTEYHDVAEIYSWYEGLAEAHPAYVTVHPSIGKTHYNTDIMAVHITDKSQPSEKKLRVYFQCLLHAREWISGPVCMYIARHFANPDPANQELMRQIEFIIVPVANPDGYQQTWLEYPKYRMWRKNTAPTRNPACDGVDLNRNFNTHWSLTGGSSDPCSEVYHGESAESELEVQTITRYIESNAPIVASIDFHSYCQEILFPPAWTNKDASNVDSMRYISGWMAYAASQAGVTYTSHAMHSDYLAAGTFPDWMLEQGVTGKQSSNCSPVSFTVELRPQDTPGDIYGFMVPTEQIVATCEEMMPAVLKFSHLVIDQFSSC